MTETTEEPQLTDFEKEMREGKKYWLGPIVRSHKIGEYQFIEYKDKDYELGSPTRGQLTGTHHFSIFIDGKSTCRSSETLDGALACAIAYKHEGPNSRAGHYFMKMIRKED